MFYTFYGKWLNEQICLDLMEGPWKYYIGFLFVIFVIIMSIIMMNLITGLALDDIQKIAENAEYQKLETQVRLILRTALQ